MSDACSVYQFLYFARCMTVKSFIENAAIRVLQTYYVRYALLLLYDKVNRCTRYMPIVKITTQE